MPSIKILVAGLPLMLGDIVGRLLREQSDLEVLAIGAGEATLARAVRDTGARVLILGEQVADRDRLVGSLHRENPALKILIVDESGRSAVLSELSPRSRPLGELSPESLLEVVRRAAEREDWGGET